MSIVAYRRWRVTADGRLKSTAMREVWQPGKLTATCGLCGSVPDAGCTCGYYARTLPIAPCTCGDPTHPRHGAVGVVRLGGRVIVCESGYRAQYAQVLAYVDHTGLAVADHYGAAVYRDAEAMWSEWAPGVAGREPVAPGGDWCCRPPLAVAGFTPSLMVTIAAEAQQAAWAFRQAGIGVSALADALAGIPPDVATPAPTEESPAPGRPRRPLYTDDRPRSQSPYGPRQRWDRR